MTRTEAFRHLPASTAERVATTVEQMVTDLTDLLAFARAAGPTAAVDELAAAIASVAHAARTTLGEPVYEAHPALRPAPVAEEGQTGVVTALALGEGDDPTTDEHDIITPAP